MDATVICFSSLEELEEATRGIGSGEAVTFKFVSGSCSLKEAGTIFRLLGGKVASSRGLWKVDNASLKMLRTTTHHYENLDLLEISLDLMELDLEDSVLMRRERFDGVRMTANQLVTTAHASNANVFEILDDVIIDSQRLARICRGLGFGRDDIEVPSLTQDDLDWLMAEGAGALVLADGCGGEVLQDGGAGLIDGAKEVLPGLADPAPAQVLAGGGDKVVAGLLDRGEALTDGPVDCAEVLAGGGEKLLPDLVDGAEASACGGAKEVLPDLADPAEVLAGGGDKAFPGLIDRAEALMDGLVDRAEVLAGGGDKVFPGLLDRVEALTDGLIDRAEVFAGGGEKLLPVLIDSADSLAGGGDKVLPVLVDGSEALAGSGEKVQGDWIRVKENTVLGLIRLKIRKLKEAIVCAKGRVMP